MGLWAALLRGATVLCARAPRCTPGGWPAPVLGHLILVTCGVLVPLLVERAMTGRTYENLSYPILQAPNWAWTLELMSRTSTFRSVLPSLGVILAGGGAIFLVHFLISAR